jgi:hypothetical protein
MCASGSGSPAYLINGSRVPFVPQLVRVIRLEAHYRHRDVDDLQWLSSAIGMSPNMIKNLVQDIEAFPYSHVKNLRWQIEQDTTTLFVDLDGTRPGASVQDLSGSEKETILIEFATAAARASGRYCPTLLILDGCPLILFKGIFDFYSHHLLDAENQFQTIMCVPSPKLDLDALFWKGWEVVRFESVGNRTRLCQTLRKPA